MLMSGWYDHLFCVMGSFRMAVALLTKCRHRSRTRKWSWEKRVAKKGVANIGSVLQYSLREFFFTIPMRTVTRKVYISLIVVVTPGSLLL